MRHRQWSPISRAEFDLYVKNLLQGKQQELTPDQKNQVLDDLINMQVLADQADKDGLENDPETEAQLDAAAACGSSPTPSRRNTQSPRAHGCRAARRVRDRSSHRWTRPSTTRGTSWLRPRTRLAEQIIKKLKGGAKFEDLAKAQSTDTGSKNNGGDLGWFTTSRMVKPFADAVKGLKKGEVTPEPVQTQFGWHVIQLEDTREAAPPPFDQVKAQLTNRWSRRSCRLMSTDLKKNAKIEKKTL